MIVTITNVLKIQVYSLNFFYFSKSVIDEFQNSFSE